MSVFGDGIAERLHFESPLNDPDNPGRRVIDGTVGEWLTQFDEFPFLEQFFIGDASGRYLDLHGRDFGLPRTFEEVDDDYRQRIVLESLGHLTVPYLLEVYGLVLYCFVEDFDPSENTLTSDNPYACSRHMTVATDEVQGILGKKFVIGSDLSFIEVE